MITEGKQQFYVSDKTKSSSVCVKVHGYNTRLYEFNIFSS